MSLELRRVESVHIFIFLLGFQNDFITCSAASLLQSEIAGLKEYSLYYSFNKTKEVLMKYYEKRDEVKILVDEFDFRCANSYRAPAKNFPFISVEGAYRRTRNMVANKLARRIQARFVSNPPQFMVMSNYFFNDTLELRRAFYSLAVHAVACKARELLASTPVIVSGYWIDQAAFGVAKMFDRIPPASSGLYEWPQELLRPDRIYLINPPTSTLPAPLHPYKPKSVFPFRDNARIPLRAPSVFSARHRLIKAIMRFRNPYVTEINTTRDYDDIVTIIIHFMNQFFNARYPVSI